MSTDVYWTTRKYRLLKERAEEYLTERLGKPIVLEPTENEMFYALIPRDLTKEELKHINTKLRWKRPPG
ncbi:hypothetical protein GGTG_10625 [Gaeumannomyces tritici R3-111a-1]|uniref:Uncharacterized protein n=1 Tax=Gaeumannomyces tritici (strain R3-111a-1) TaxID=644352 RepID=J3PAV0_GAET3|nr:hypothetical protein GGTG_10625 [Gaeumannomyces tritici R3-111a-1]EJT71366.1 hypothetical protein GGTG_10625 [Gaeumannomyces tritici R3-111a-1]